jgi:hypothetical protein
MPDVSTHFMFGIALAMLVCIRRSKEEGMLIVLGSVLIDIERPVSWILRGTVLEWITLSSGFHSILGAFSLAFFASSCFDSEMFGFWYRFKLIFIGCIEHLVLDMIMFPWAEHGLYLLYPIKIPFAFHIFWSDYSGYPLLGFIALAVSFTIWIIWSKAFQRARKSPVEL